MKLDFDVIEAVKMRRSVRTFDTTRPLTPDDISSIMRYVDQLDTPFGTEGFIIGATGTSDAIEGVKLGTYGVIKGADRFLGLAVMPGNDVLVRAAYAFETLVLWLTSQGIGTVWLGGTLKRDAFAKAMRVLDDMTLPIISPIGYPTDKRFVERVMRTFTKGDSRKPWDKMFYDGAVGVALTPTSAGAYATALDMLRLAPSATNTQPWRVVRDGDAWHFYGDFKDSAADFEKTMRYIDMGIALCHFGLVAQQQGLQGRFVQIQPTIPVPNTYHYISTWQADDH